MCPLLGFVGLFLGGMCVGGGGTNVDEKDLGGWFLGGGCLGRYSRYLVAVYSTPYVVM